MEPLTSDPKIETINTSIGEIQLTVEGAPKAPLLLLVHGVPGSHRDFRYLAPHLTKAYRVVRLDMPGFGQSKDVGRNSVSGWVEVIQVVAHYFQPAHLYIGGHSFGGGPVIHAAASMAAVRGVVLIASLGARPHRGYGYKNPAMYRFIAATMHIPGLKRYVRLQIEKGYKRLKLKLPPDYDSQILIRQLKVIGSINFAKVGSAAKKIKAPVLQFHALDDQLIEPEIVRELQQDFQNSQLCMYNSGGHHLQKSRAAEIAEKILTLLE